MAESFQRGLRNVEDDPRSGRSISSTNDQTVEVVRAVMAKHRRMSVRMIAEETDLDKNADHRILTDHLHSKTSPASPNGHCRRLGVAPR